MQQAQCSCVFWNDISSLLLTQWELVTYMYVSIVQKFTIIFIRMKCNVMNRCTSFPVPAPWEHNFRYVWQWLSYHQRQIHMESQSDIYFKLRDFFHYQSFRCISNLISDIANLIRAISNSIRARDTSNSIGDIFDNPSQICHQLYLNISLNIFKDVSNYNKRYI